MDLIKIDFHFWFISIAQARAAPNERNVHKRFSFGEWASSSSTISAAVYNYGPATQHIIVIVPDIKWFRLGRTLLWLPKKIKLISCVADYTRTFCTCMTLPLHHAVSARFGSLNSQRKVSERTNGAIHPFLVFFSFFFLRSSRWLFSMLNYYYIVCGTIHVCQSTAVYPSDQCVCVVCALLRIWNLVQMILNNFVLAFPLYHFTVFDGANVFRARCLCCARKIISHNSIICCRQQPSALQTHTHTTAHTLSHFFSVTCFFCVWIQLYRLPST